MRIKMIMALAAVGGLFLTGTANAYPIEDTALTENTFYDSGKLATAKCAAPRVKNNNLSSARGYVTALTGCLNTSWGAHLTGSDLLFGKPKLKFVKKLPKKYCDFDVDLKLKSQAYYCAESRTILLQLGTDWLRDADDLWLAHVTGVMYGYHVQNLTGIEDAFQAAPYDNKSELNEQIRRASLQADCLAGAFIRSTRSSLGVSAGKWNELLRILEASGDAKGDARLGGKGSARVAWTKRGYAGGDPASCNAWTASSAKVA
jgi:predicted metalloprotease